MSSSRQLAAIMFFDIAGYTSTIQDDEALGIRLQQKMKNKLEQEVDKHHGRIVEMRGDGGLCSFSSTIEAVQAALSLQLDMQTPPLVPLRIGMHTGDVMMKGNIIFGDGVNIASRLESFAVPGSIFISGRVYDDIKNQKDIQAVSMGSYALKNVKDPVEIFAISNPGIKIPPANSLEGKGEKLRQKCILVLPFVNMSTDAEQEYFSDGLTEELISCLSKVKDMRVISRTTSMQYKNTTKTLKTVAQETDVNYILEGSVRKHGNDLRITAQFIDAIHDVHMWADSYRGTMEAIFDIQEKVAEKIVKELRIKLSGDEKDTMQKRYTYNPEAYQLYLQGHHFWKKRNEESLNTAVKYFEKAIEQDPGYALAWAGLSDTYNLMGEYTNIPRKELLPKQMAAVNRALAIDNRLGEAHVSLAISLMLNDWDWKNAEKEFQKGIELSPNYASGHHWYGQWLLFRGRFEEALEEISLAVELDPVSHGILKDKGILYYYNRQYDKAIDMGMITLELDPQFDQGHRLLSLAYHGKGMFEDALRENEEWGMCTKNKIKTEVALAHLLASAGRKEEAKKIMEREDIKKHLGANDYRGAALVYTALGEKDIAFEWLNKSFALREESITSLKIDPKFDALRSDPRFDELVKKIGL